MNIAIYRSGHSVSVLNQENALKEFAQKHQLSIDDYYIDFLPATSSLEDRVELKEFIYSLEEESKVLVYDFWVLSNKVGELVKLCTCFFKKGIVLVNCDKNVIIDKNTPSLLSLGLINEFRDDNLKSAQDLKIGRPKGSISKSKFDRFRNDVLTMLREGISVSKIARELNLNRSSLKDYIESRNLKEIAASRERLEGSLNISKSSNAEFLENIKCPLKHKS